MIHKRYTTHEASRHIRFLHLIRTCQVGEWASLALWAAGQSNFGRDGKDVVEKYGVFDEDGSVGHVRSDFCTPLRELDSAVCVDQSGLCDCPQSGVNWTTGLSIGTHDGERTGRKDVPLIANVLYAGRKAGGAAR